MDLFKPKNADYVEGTRFGFAAGLIFSVGIAILVKTAKVIKSERYPFSN